MDDPHSNKQMQTKEPKNGIHFLNLFFYFAAGSVFFVAYFSRQACEWPPQLMGFMQNHHKSLLRSIFQICPKCLIFCKPVEEKHCPLFLGTQAFKANLKKVQKRHELFTMVLPKNF